MLSFQYKLEKLKRFRIKLQIYNKFVLKLTQKYKKPNKVVLKQPKNQLKRFKNYQ